MDRRDLPRERKSVGGFFCLVVFCGVFFVCVFCCWWCVLGFFLFFFLKLAVEENCIKSDLPPHLIQEIFITCHMSKPSLSLTEYEKLATTLLQLQAKYCQKMFSIIEEFKQTVKVTRHQLYEQLQFIQLYKTWNNTVPTTLANLLNFIIFLQNHPRKS